MPIYLDNAASTPLHPEVIEKMTEVMANTYGNPSSIHSFGRTSKAELENARRQVSKWLNCKPTEITFTGSGTEADNLAIRSAVYDLGVKHIISSPIEHKAVLDTSWDLDRRGIVQLHLIEVDQFGRANLDSLEELAAQYPRSLISLMHANNELGTLNDLHAISRIARAHDCYFHSDSVQSMTHHRFDLGALDIDFMACSAHKFHGPKGVGFLYRKNGLKLKPILTGGGQESNLRAGTENIVGIAGLAKAFDLAYSHLDRDRAMILALKNQLKSDLVAHIPGIQFNGDTSDDGALFTVLNISLPPHPNNDTILFQMDLAGIAVSGGSACNSGAIKASHVLEGINVDSNRAALRVSFSAMTNADDINRFLEVMKEHYSS